MDNPTPPRDEAKPSRRVRRRLPRRAAVLLAAVVGLIASIGMTSSAQAGPFLHFVNDVSRKCLDVTDASNIPGTQLQQWKCNQVDEQVWLPIDVGNGYLMFESNNTSNQCLDVQDGSAVPETPVDQWFCSVGGPRMWWRSAPADDQGHEVLQSALGNLCMALGGGFSSRNGWPIVIHECATTSGQFWRFT
ncbi:RICIN domain-containing protein [Flindersiella endophytica]